VNSAGELTTLKLYISALSRASGVTLFLLATTAFADDLKPIPGSAYGIESSMDQEFAQEEPKETKLEELLESSEVSLKLRNYYLNRSKPTSIDSYGWAQGGILSHKMGRVGGIFSMTTEYMGSYPLEAPDEHGGTLLLDKHQIQIDVFGVVNPRFSYAGQVLSTYRQRYNLPFVNEQDNRVLPNTFEGYTIAQPLTSSKNFQYIAGYIDSIKKRDTERFVSMSDAAGVTQADRGMFVGGARYFPMPDLSIAGINYHVTDVMNIVYAESNYKFKICEDFEQVFSAQFAEQSSVGDDLLRGKDYSTGFWGVQSASSYEGFVFKVAATFNDETADIRSPYGSYPGYNSSIVEDFNRAGENAWQVGLSYDLAKVGLDGFKLSTAFIQGNDAISESTGGHLPNKAETDATLDYRVADGTLKGLWVRVRGAFIDDEKDGTTQDLRAIVNYDIALFGPQKTL
jgi:outer membrane porin, OprD family